jgi:3-deoxy-manno-octulosonate cytidylyltransferase (CMP-KDO synthetase)
MPDQIASNPIVVVPARMSATRLPGKPLADIHGEPMIVHVWRRAVEAGVGPVIVATDAPEIAHAIEAAGGVAVMTGSQHPSGTDRIAEALARHDPARRHDIVINVQGDLPTIDSAAVHAVTVPFAEPDVDMTTICAVITREEEKTAPSVVKLIGSEIAPGRLRCLYFTRATAPTGPGPLLHHIGLYGYRRAVLERLVALPPSPLEQREKLEQLRALEAGLRIDAMIVDTVPLGVDTPQDLDHARRMLAPR